MGAWLDEIRFDVLSIDECLFVESCISEFRFDV